ncbi:MAG TPA: glycosyltransferase family 39 protein [Ardenticatenaceae bacterium]|jgi:hypothetical protein
MPLELVDGEETTKHDKWLMGVLGLLLAVGAFLRLYKLGKDSLWFDEIDALMMVALPLRQMFQGLAWHASPPLDYLVLRLISIFGRDETLVRLPAALFGIMAIYVLYRAGRQLAGTAVGLGAAAMLTFSMTAIVYAQEARMYSLFLFLTTVLLWCCGRLIEEPLSWRRWAITALAALLALYTHYYAVLVVAGLGFLWLGLCFWPRWNRALFVRGFGSFGGVAVLFAPWLPTMLEQSARRGGVLGYALAREDYWRVTRHFVSGGATNRYSWFYLFLFACGLVYCLRRKRLVAGLLCAFVVIPALLAYYVPSLSATVTPRNMIFLIPGYLIGIAAGFYALARFVLSIASRQLQPPERAPTLHSITTALTLAGLVVIALGSSMGMLRQYHSNGWWMRDARHDWRLTSQFLQRTMQPGDLVLVDAVRTRYTLSFYLDPLAIEGTNYYDFTYNPANADTGATRFVPVVTQHTSAPVLEEALAAAKTVWVINPAQIDFGSIGVDSTQIVPVEVSNIPVARLPGGSSGENAAAPSE